MQNLLAAFHHAFNSNRFQMAKVFLIFFSVISGFILSCKPATPLRNLIHETDVVRVYIYSGEQVAVKYFTNDITRIKQWDGYIKDDTAAAGNCSFEGRLVFKVYEDSTVMKFGLQPGCQIVSYSLKGVEYTKSLTEEGVKYLQSLRKIN